MDVAAKKVELIEWLARLQDKELLEQVDNLRKKSATEAYQSKLKPMSSWEYKSMLEDAEDDYNKGKVTSQEGLERESSDW